MWATYFCVAVVATTLRTTSRQRSDSTEFRFDYSHHGQDWIQGSCASRERQSPINIDDITSAPTGKLSFNYQIVGSGFEIANNGHSLSADFAGLGYGGVTYENSWYNLLNVNFHAESEHTLQGRHLPVEIHLVHKKYDSDALLIVAVLIDGPPPAFLQLQQLPTAADPDFNPTLQFFTQVHAPQINQKVISQASDLNALNLNTLLEGGTFTEYAGSLTAPPCAEIVTWLVRREPLKASASQVAYLHNAVYGMTADFGNYRDIMPINGRPMAVRQGVREEPPPEPPAPPIPIGPNPRTDREFRAMKWAKDALKVAGDATRYVKDLDQRLRNAALAHARALAPDLTKLAVPDASAAAAPTAPTAAGSPAGPTPEDVAEMARSMASHIADTAEQAISEARVVISQEAKTAAADAAAETAKLVAQIPAAQATQQPVGNSTNSSLLETIRKRF